MELKDFIEKSLQDITSAIHNSSKKMIKDKTGKGIPDHKEITISFDVAVTVGDSNEQSAGAKINVLSSLGLGASAKSGKEFQEINRLSFVIPVKIDTIGSKNYTVI